MPVPARSVKLCIAGKISAAWMFLATILVTGSFVNYMLNPSLPQEIAATKLLLDPGPRHRCYRYQDLATNYSYVSKVPECQPIKEYAGCPAWRYSSYNSGQQHGELLAGANGSLIDVRLVNNARGAGGNGTEISFDYYEPGCSITKSSKTTQYNLLDYDQWTFEYDVTIQPDNKTRLWTGGTWQSARRSSRNRALDRKYLATEFTYQYPDPSCSSSNSTTYLSSNRTDFGNSSCKPLESTLRIIHFDSLLTLSPSNTSNTTSGNGTSFLAPYGIESQPSTTNPTTTVTLSSTHQLPEGAKSHISLDFRDLYERFSSADAPCSNSSGTNSRSDHPPWLNAYVIRIVSGSVGTDSVIEVGNVSAVLKKNTSAGNGRGDGGTPRLKLAQGKSKEVQEEDFKVVSRPAAQCAASTGGSASAFASNDTAAAEARYGNVSVSSTRRLLSEEGKRRRAMRLRA